MAKSGKVAIVTGSATGLGAECAVDLAGRGWNVAINYTKSKKEADETYAKVKDKGVEAILVQADMGQDADCRKLAAETFNFLYTEHLRKIPDRAPRLEACYRAVIDAVRAEVDSARRCLFIGGKSMGGRIATQVAAADPHLDLAGLVLLILTFAENVLVALLGFLIMLGCLLVIERNVRKLGKHGMASITGGWRANGGLRGIFGDQGRAWRDRFRRDDNN